MSRWPHARSNAAEIRDAIARVRKPPASLRQQLHELTWPFDPVFVGHAVELLARAKPPLARVSASYLERKLGISYGAAGLLVDTLARTGLCERSKRYEIRHLIWPPPPGSAAADWLPPEPPPWRFYAPFDQPTGEGDAATGTTRHSNGRLPNRPSNV